MREDWIECKLEDLLNYIQPTKFIVASTNYSDSYKTPVLTAGKSFIIGYTDETSNIFDNTPVIIFDDFTTATQFVNFKFKVKSSAMKILSPTSSLVNIKYVHYFMQTIRQHTDTHKRYWISIFSQLPIKLAPLPEHRAIVTKIEQLFSELDNGITNLKAAKAKLEIYRQAVLKKAFEGELTKELREKNQSTPWKKLRISAIGEIITGNTPSKKNASYYSSNEYPFYKPTDLAAGSDVKYSIDGLSKEGFETGRIAPENSILVTCIGATIGKTGLIKRKGCFNQQINAIVPDERMDSKYIYYQAISVVFQHQIKTNASATTLPILNKGKFSILKMAICPLEEQKQIVLEIETRLSVCDNILRNIEEGLEKAEALRQSILKKAFEGKLLNETELAACRQQPDWEPAEKLLARIRRDAMHRVSTTKRAPTHERRPHKQKPNLINWMMYIDTNMIGL